MHSRSCSERGDIPVRGFLLHGDLPEALMDEHDLLWFIQYVSFVSINLSVDPSGDASICNIATDLFMMACSECVYVFFTTVRTKPSM